MPGVVLVIVFLGLTVKAFVRAQGAFRRAVHPALRAFLFSNAYVLFDALRRRGSEKDQYCQKLIRLEKQKTIHLRGTTGLG